jgi:hypothetical protein
MAIRDQDIVDWFVANEGADDATIAKTMDQFKLTPADIARATGTDLNDVTARYQAVSPLDSVATQDSGASSGSSGLTNEQAQKLIQDQYATIGRSGVGTGANEIDQVGLDAWTNALVSGEFKPEDLSSRFSTAVTDYMAQNPDDQYTQYVKIMQMKRAALSIYILKRP